MNISSNNTQSGEDLIRGIDLKSAVALNMIDMIGVGPFITIPLIVAAMGGPQALLGWIFGAALVMCDGMVWAELGAAIPGSGGSYRYLKEIYGPDRFGKLAAFLFIWQLSFSAPLSIASGCIGLSQYASFLVPSLGQTLFQQTLHADIPLIGAFNASIVLTTGSFAAMGVCFLAVVLLYRRITFISALSRFLWVGVALAAGWIVIAGVTHFNAARAFSFPENAFHPDGAFFTGLGAGMLVAVYDYWGYYNICFLGGEVKNPGHVIPRAVLISIVLVAAIYLVMNISILGVIPWQELSAAAGSDARKYVVSVFMSRLYGNSAGILATVLIMWTAFASVFSLLLGYSRVPYAAAIQGDYFHIFGKVHLRNKFPHVSLLFLGGAAMVCCLFKLADVIAALVVIRILIQFLLQTAGVVVLRIRRPEMPRPFRMWLYPVPAALAFAGFFYVLVMRKDFQTEIQYAFVILIAGIAAFLFRSRSRHEWPFLPKTADIGR